MCRVESKSRSSPWIYRLNTDPVTAGKGRKSSTPSGPNTGHVRPKDAGIVRRFFKNPVIAEKKLTVYFIPTTCPSCGHLFNAELGETRMAPAAERVVLENEPSFTELSQNFAKRLKTVFSRGWTRKKRAGTGALDLIAHEDGFKCPNCGVFAGGKIKSILDRHAKSGRASDLKKKDLVSKSRHAYIVSSDKSKMAYGRSW